MDERLLIVTSYFRLNTPLNLSVSLSLTKRMLRMLSSLKIWSMSPCTVLKGRFPTYAVNGGSDGSSFCFLGPPEVPAPVRGLKGEEEQQKMQQQQILVFLLCICDLHSKKHVCFFFAAAKAQVTAVTAVTLTSQAWPQTPEYFKVIYCMCTSGWIHISCTFVYHVAYVIFYSITVGFSFQTSMLIMFCFFIFSSPTGVFSNLHSEKVKQLISEHIILRSSTNQILSWAQLHAVFMMKKNNYEATCEAPTFKST